MGGKRIAVNPAASCRGIGVDGHDAHRAGGVEVGGSVLEAGLHVPAVVTGVRVVGSACLRRGGVEPVGSVVVRKARELLRARCGRSLRHAAVVKVEGRLHALHEQQQHDAHLHPPR